MGHVFVMADETYTVYTDDTGGAYVDRAVIFPTGAMLDFKLQACKPAYIHLVDTPFSSSSAGYRLAC